MMTTVQRCANREGDVEDCLVMQERQFFAYWLRYEFGSCREELADLQA